MSDIGDQIKMRDLAMLAEDRERMQNEWDGFDEMTLNQFRAASKERVDELLDLYNELGGSR